MLLSIILASAHVMPAKAGIHATRRNGRPKLAWTPAYAGVTLCRRPQT